MPFNENTSMTKIDEGDVLSTSRFGTLTRDYSKQVKGEAGFHGTNPSITSIDEVNYTDDQTEKFEPNGKSKGCVVNFGKVQVHKHRMTLGDHPDADGVPVTLAWDVEDYESFENVDVYEQAEDERHGLRRIPLTERQRIASRNHTNTSLRLAEEERMKIIISRNSSEYDDIKLTLEKMKQVSKKRLLEREAKHESSRSDLAYGRSLEPDRYLEFSESGSGHIASSGRTMPIEFCMKIVIADLETFMDQKAEAKVTGSARIPALSSGPLSIFNGSMRLIKMDGGGTSTSQMRYELPMENRNGERYTLVGMKINPGDNGGGCFGSCGEAYDDFTQLRCDIHEGGVDGGIVGRGLLQTSPMNVLKMLFSFHGAGACKFKRYFLPSLFSIYFRAFFPKKTSAL